MKIDNSVTLKKKKLRAMNVKVVKKKRGYDGDGRVKEVYLRIKKLVNME